MANFWPKPWTNPFGIISIFGLFQLCLFIAQKGVFSFWNIVTDIFSRSILFKKKMEKSAIFDQNHGLTRMQKSQFSTFPTSCFYSLERRFFVPEYRKRHFLALYYLEKKDGKMANFWPKPWTNPFGKISVFGLF